MPGWRSQCRLVLLNSLTCGLEICVAAGITYVPPLLLEAGVEEQYMTMVLGKPGGGGFFIYRGPVLKGVEGQVCASPARWILYLKQPAVSLVLA